MENLIEVVGIGLEGTAGLAPAVLQLVEQASLLVGSDRHLGYFLEHPARKLCLSSESGWLASLQAEKVDERMVILASGDPLFFGLGRLLLEHFPKERLRFHPHVSSVQLAFNRVKLPWQTAQILSVHGRPLAPLGELLQQGVETLALLTDNLNTPAAIVRYILNLDLPSRYQGWVCEDLGDSQEKISYFPAANLASLLERSFSPLNIVILRRESGDQPLPSNLPLLGLPDEVFLSFADRPGLITKREIRLAILGELALQPQQIVWDIGAGTGSVSIEIARLSPTSQVYAIEKTAIGITLIQKNCDRLRVNNVMAIKGAAPEILANLPPPDRIFIGGSGGQLIPILDVCDRQLQPGKTLVLALATLEHLSEAIAWFQQHRWDFRLLQLQIARSVAIADLTRLAPLNPVTLITVTR